MPLWDVGKDLINTCKLFADYQNLFCLQFVASFGEALTPTGPPFLQVLSELSSACYIDGLGLGLTLHFKVNGLNNKNLLSIEGLSADLGAKYKICMICIQFSRYKLKNYPSTKVDKNREMTNTH